MNGIFRSVMSVFATEHFRSDVRRDMILERRWTPQIVLSLSLTTIPGPQAAKIGLSSPGFRF